MTHDHREGCDDFEVTVSDFPPPVCEPGGPYEGAVEGRTIELDGSESYDLDGEIVSWTWSTTDAGVTSGEVDPADPMKVSFRADDDRSGVLDTFTVEVCVTDDDGGTGCTSFQVDVFDLPPQPYLSIDDVSQAEGDTPDTTEFEFIASLDQPAFGDVSFEYATVDVGEATSGDDDQQASGPSSSRRVRLRWRFPSQ